MTLALLNSLVVAVHTIYPAARLGEHKFVDPVLADLALKTVRVVGVVAGHDRLVEDGLLADIAAVGAVGAYGRAVREQQQVRVRRHLVSAFRALEAVDVEEGLAGKWEHDKYRNTTAAA